MAQVNIYKISESKKDDLLNHLEQQYKKLGNQEVNYKSVADTTGEILPNVQYSISLYYAGSNSEKPLTWNWVLKIFDLENKYSCGNSRGIILVECDNEIYAITFGYSYYKIDQLADKSWAFMFARRLRYKNIKVTALTNPNSQRNKTVNTYLDYDDLDFDSGEALTKLKAKVEISDNFDLFSETIEFGNSIKFLCTDPTLDKIIQIIEFVNYTIANKNELVKIPYFHEIKDCAEKERLNKLMLQDINENSLSVDFSEYQIYATKIVFNDTQEFVYRLGNSTMISDKISWESLLEFIQRSDLNIERDLLKIQVIVNEDGHSKYTTDIYKLLFYTNEHEKVLFTDGNWYKYNEDYLLYLYDSVSEIPVSYEPTLDYSETEYKNYIKEKYKSEHKLEEYKDLSEDTIMEKLARKYYKERFYNDYLVRMGFSNFDRDLETIGKHKIEVMDLYKNQSMYSVKFGNSSGKLCYAVDQSLEAIKAYHKRQIPRLLTVKDVFLWLVLERSDLPLKDGNPDINELKMLILKNKLDYWKKSVRLMGYTPQIRINYVRP